MKMLQSKLWAKLLSGFLLFVFCLTFVMSGVVCVLLGVKGVYADGEKTDVLRDGFYVMPSFQTKMRQARDYWYQAWGQQENPEMWETEWEKSFQAEFSPENSNFYFVVLNPDGKIVFSGGEEGKLQNGKPDDTQSEYLCRNSWYMNWDSEEDYMLVGYVREELTADDAIAHEYRLVQWCVQSRWFLVALTVVGVLCAGVLLVFLMCAAGHCAGYESIHLNWFDQIPLDILLTVWGAIGIALIWFGAVILDEIQSNAATFSAVLVILMWTLGAVVLLTTFLMSFAARYKAGKWYRNTIIFKVLHLVWRFLCWLGRGARWFAQNLPLYWRTGFCFVGLCILDFLMMAMFADNFGAYLFIWSCTRIVLAAALAVVVVGMRKIQKGGERLAAGALDEQINTRHMFWVFRAHAENLNAIGEGMQKAVEQQTRAERLKTELITNVSHDIKTPLTSIVNYVDLMKKEKVEPKKAREYLEVLDRQSARLKKLTEDLVEASKASTGNIACSVEPTDTALLLGQVMGEYQERLAAGKLETVMQLAPDCPKIMADGRLLWRVLDNLLSNICKYAMPGTRVYLSSSVQEGSVTICFKNISRYPLNISADELMERFVRGDSSRNTEGSGLGLSIAQSLTELQRGRFAVEIDGDLFKALVSFETVHG